VGDFASQLGSLIERNEIDAAKELWTHGFADIGLRDQLVTHHCNLGIRVLGDTRDLVEGLKLMSWMNRRGMSLTRETLQPLMMAIQRPEQFKAGLALLQAMKKFGIKPRASDVGRIVVVGLKARVDDKILISIVDDMLMRKYSRSSHLDFCKVVLYRSDWLTANLGDYLVKLVLAFRLSSRLHPSVLKKLVPAAKRVQDTQTLVQFTQRVLESDVFEFPAIIVERLLEANEHELAYKILLSTDREHLKQQLFIVAFRYYVAKQDNLNNLQTLIGLAKASGIDISAKLFTRVLDYHSKTIELNVRAVDNIMQLMEIENLKPDLAFYVKCILSYIHAQSFGQVIPLIKRTLLYDIALDSDSVWDIVGSLRRLNQNQLIVDVCSLLAKWDSILLSNSRTRNALIQSLVNLDKLDEAKSMLQKRLKDDSDAVSLWEFTPILLHEIHRKDNAAVFSFLNSIEYGRCENADAVFFMMKSLNHSKLDPDVIRSSILNLFEKCKEIPHLNSEVIYFEVITLASMTGDSKLLASLNYKSRFGFSHKFHCRIVSALISLGQKQDVWEALDPNGSVLPNVSSPHSLLEEAIADFSLRRETKSVLKVLDFCKQTRLIQKMSAKSLSHLIMACEKSGFHNDSLNLLKQGLDSGAFAWGNLPRTKSFYLPGTSTAIAVTALRWMLEVNGAPVYLTLDKYRPEEHNNLVNYLRRAFPERKITTLASELRIQID
jgi:hypothetical protein